MLLSLETSGLTGSIALWREGEIVERSLATAGRRHAQTLTLEIHDLLAELRVPIRSLVAITVSLGPGSFTGLRVGVVCAKTLGYALGCRVLGVETFAGIAQQAPESESRLHIVSDAQRGDLFHQIYERCGDGWQATTELTIVSGDAWSRTLAANDVVAGSGVTKLSAEVTPARLCMETWSREPTATGISQAALSRYQRGEMDNIWTLAPIYLRPSAAEEQWAKRQVTPSS
ncbi:tRNA (adenosine(37)-N6)-threonylcarbamoyltransferase complex dimerization subunit type 1 TsaB [bacterium]|nr:tRNA (adenosine(37)-N6)-threonylcarbamoyltransferase complex dimerization subunit type 1 TsaB [bacterium]